MITIETEMKVSWAGTGEKKKSKLMVFFARCGKDVCSCDDIFDGQFQRFSMIRVAPGVMRKIFRSCSMQWKYESSESDEQTWLHSGFKLLWQIAIVIGDGEGTFGNLMTQQTSVEMIAMQQKLLSKWQHPLINIISKIILTSSHRLKWPLIKTDFRLCYEIWFIVKTFKV